MWEPHLVVRGCCVWHASVERVFGAGIWWCRGCVPPCVGAPVCGWCVCGVDLSDTLPYCSPYCGALPSTSRVFGPLASSSLSLLHRASFTPTPHGSVVPVVGPPLHCTSAVPHNPHPHTPLSSLRAVTHLMCCVLPCWCVCAHTGTVFCFLSAVCPPWFAALTTVSHPTVRQCCVLFLV